MWVRYAFAGELMLCGYVICAWAFLTFHEGCVGAAVVVKVSAVRVVQAVVSQTVCVAKTLQDAIHKTLHVQAHVQIRKHTHKHKKDKGIHILNTFN